MKAIITIKMVLIEVYLIDIAVTVLLSLKASLLKMKSQQKDL